MGHALDRGAKKAAWAATLRTVIDGEIAMDYCGNAVPARVRIGRPEREHVMPCSAEAAVLYALTVVLNYDVMGSAFAYEDPLGFSTIHDADGPIRVLTDLAPVAAFLRGEAPLSTHVVLRALQEAISRATETPIRKGRMVLVHSPRPKGRPRDQHLEQWLADAQLVPTRELRAVRQSAATVLAEWEPRAERVW